MTCPRLWEAEAIEDGRRGTLGHASFERHLAQCAECSREARSLCGLREGLGGLEPRRLSMLEQRRQRAELLRRANERIITRRESPRRWVAATAALALLATVLLVVGLQVRHTAPQETSSLPPTGVQPIDAAGARDDRKPRRAAIASSDPVAGQVEHRSPARDTEQEVLIDAVEGSRRTEARDAIEGRAASLSEIPRRARDRAEGTQAHANRARAATQGSSLLADQDDSPATASRTGGSSPTAPAAARDFAAAMAAFTAHSYLDADERFAAFVLQFPQDPRREDAAYLRAVIATRRGDAAAAVARARDYIRRFPQGLRRAEMDRLAAAPW